jgi:hypothetical protein
VPLTLFGIIGSLVVLGGGVWRRHTAATIAGLVAFVVLALLAVPPFVEAVARHDDARVSAIVGLDSAAAIALATLVVWRSTRRYPDFSAIALLLVGIAVALLMTRM